MTDPVALALIAAAVPVVATLGGNFVLAWRAAILANAGRKMDEEWKAKIVEENRAAQTDRARLHELVEDNMVISTGAKTAAERSSDAIESVRSAVVSELADARTENVRLISEVKRLTSLLENMREFELANRAALGPGSAAKASPAVDG